MQIVSEEKVNDNKWIRSLITEAQVVEFLEPLYALCESLSVPATFFEITTTLGWMYFEQQQADFVVLETGLGGRLDATNVVQKPALAIITSIGLEHTRILGDTIEKIATEKAGIIKSGCPVLVGPNVPLDVIKECATAKGASAVYTLEDILGQTLPPTNDYDTENARIAEAALGILQRSNVVKHDLCLEGLNQRPPCRMEYLQTSSGRSVILDVAHNPPAIEYLLRRLQSTENLRFVIGLSSDKDLALCAKLLLSAVNDPERIHLVQAAHPRAATLERLVEAFDGSAIQFDADDRSISKQIQRAFDLGNDEETLVICGSVFLMAEAREALGIDEPRDSPYIAEVAGAGVRYAQENFESKR